MAQFELAELSQKTNDLLSRAKELFEAKNIPFSIQRNDENAVTLTFIGQYNAGKSTILKMLTGRDDIEIGAGIKTMETHYYDWNGITVVDTPGIHTGTREDHDKITYEAISRSDMLVFVITNELFDDYIGMHFRKLAIDKGKGREMILIVNKMRNTANRNSKEDQAVILEGLREPLNPLTPEQLYVTFTDAGYYLESLQETNPAKKQRKEQISGYQQFINNLNSFIALHKTAGKLTTPLYILDEKCNNVLLEYGPKSEDADIDALESNLIEQRHELITSRKRLQDTIKDIFLNESTKIRRLGVEAAECICSGCKEDEVVDVLEKKVQEANLIFENAQQNAIDETSKRLLEIGREINEIEALEITKELETRLEGKFEGLPENVKRIINKLIPGMKEVGQKITQNAYKTGIQGGLKLSNFAGSKVHEIVLKVGKFLKIKFKPWTAVKTARGVAVGGRILSILGVGLSIFMEIKSEQDEDRIQEDLKRNRQSIKQQFNEAANQLIEIGDSFIEKNISAPIGETIDELYQSIKDIRNNRIANSSFCKSIDRIQQECQSLIKKIQGD